MPKGDSTVPEMSQWLCVTMCQGMPLIVNKCSAFLSRRKCCDQERLDKPLGGGLLLHLTLKAGNPGELEGHLLHS